LALHQLERKLLPRLPGSVAGRQSSQGLTLRPTLTLLMMRSASAMSSKQPMTQS
jgi:hypothetical protein